MVKRYEKGGPMPGHWLDRTNATFVATAKEFAPLYVLASVLLLFASVALIAVLP